MSEAGKKAQSCDQDQGKPAEPGGDARAYG